MKSQILIAVVFAIIAAAAAVPVSDELEPVTVRTRIGIPVSDGVTLHLGRLPNGNPLNIFPNSDFLTQYIPFWSQIPEIPGFGFGVEVNAKEKPLQYDSAGNVVTQPPRTKKPRRN